MGDSVKVMLASLKKRTQELNDRAEHLLEEFEEISRTIKTAERRHSKKGKRKKKGKETEFEIGREDRQMRNIVVAKY